MKRKYLIGVFIATALAASAIPARKGSVYNMLQPDGSTVTLTIVGDEHNHYYLTTDLKPVIATDNGYRYATIDADGAMVVSDVIAHNPEMRTPAEANFAARTSIETVTQAMSVRAQSPRRANTHDNVGLFAGTRYPSRGKVKSLAVLVEYSDVKFKIDNPHDYFYRLLNEPGFSDYGGTGSCLDYYRDQSNGQFEPEFDLYGPVTLPQTRKYYGGNDSWGDDKNPQMMMLHAAQILDETVDFSQYDVDGDGYVDNIYIFYAGEGEATGGPAESVWPHNWEYSFTTKFDGVRFSRYACGPELGYPDEPDAIGTFVHEFAHVLGLPDLYNTIDANVNYTPGFCSVMDQGCYNNDSRTPCGFSSFERNALGWMGDNVVEILGPASCTLQPLNASNSAYLISVPDKKNEFFLFENRQKEGWDKYMPCHGMLIWHIDYDANVWANNVVNNTKSHQYVDLVEACNATYSSAAYMSRYSFPGSRKVTQFIFGGTPSFKTWKGEDLGLDITDIVETDGVITFNVAGGGNDPAGIADMTSMPAADIAVSGRAITVRGEGRIVVTDISGRMVGVGNGTLDVQTASPGIYLVRTSAGTAKVLVK